MNSQKLKIGILFMLLAGLTFSLMVVFAKLSAQHIPILQVAFFRCILSVPLLIPWLLANRYSLKVRRKKLLTQRIFFGWLAMICTFYAFTHIPIADAAVLNYTAPVWVLIFAEMYLKERISKTYWGLILIAFIGAALIVQPQLKILNWGGLVGLISGALIGWVWLMIKDLTQTENTGVLVFYFTLFAGILFIPLVIPIWQWPSAQEWIWLWSMAACASLGQSFLTAAYRYGKASTISMYSYFNVIGSIIWGFLLLGEVLTPPSILGILLIILSGIYLSQYEERLLKKVSLK